MRGHIENFLNSLMAQNCSANTIRAYRADLLHFASWLSQEISPEEITRRHGKEYLRLLNARGLKRSSVRRKLAAVKSLFAWLVSEGLIPEDVFASLSAPRVPVTIPNLPSEEEMTTLLGCKTGAFPERDRLILELLYGTGIRVQELVSIDIDDLQDNDVILIRGKGKKERLVIYGELAQDALKAYLPQRVRALNRLHHKTRALLFGIRGNCIDRLDVHSVGTIVKSAAKTLGLPQRHPHAFRHAFATHMLNRGASIVVISKLLGHARLSTTERYAQMATGRMLQVYNASHPHAKVPSGTV